MVAYLLIPLLAVLLPLPAEGRQLCLDCHPAHYSSRGSCTTCHAGNPATRRRDLAHAGLIGRHFAGSRLPDSPAVRQGRALIDQLACRRCHRIAGRGNLLAASLDGAVRQRIPDELLAAIITPARAMPDFRLAAADASTIVNALLADAAPAAAAPLRVVRFSRHQQGSDPFSRKCGACHRLLSRSLGALGSGIAGPDLSGLLTDHYPKTLGQTQAWKMDRLVTWLKNPRALRPNASMQPQSLTRPELDGLHILLAEGDPSLRSDPSSPP